MLEATLDTTLGNIATFGQGHLPTTESTVHALIHNALTICSYKT